ncbi:hypothetical protein PG997_010554 [Apiospora hydei]|uniref:MYND-type domain-containing protein n=1 Tax=Apiospora hydei TaxID=1337664 RepID=A0ABR1VGJ2_9PEZI
MSLEPICANRPCGKPGTASCGSCLMVLYCNQECQKAHWPNHKADCKASLLKSTWLPQWDTQRRIPAFMGDGVSMSVFNAEGKYPWGNMPAYDILNLPGNEGSNFQSDLDLLFAASGDLRNVFKTIVAVPSNYKANLQITINDRDIYIVARNVLMLLLLLVEKDPVVAAQNVVHLWYSAFITPSLMNTLKTEVEPLLRAVCTKIEHRSDSSLLGKTFGLPSGNLRVLLNKRSWNLLLDYTKVADVTVVNAQEKRRAVMLAPSRIDYRERAYYQEDPPTRFGAHKFRERGILLPLGASTDTFTVPNPTLFTGAGGWPLMDSSDPRNGWLMSQIRKSRTAAADNDVFGQLYYHIVDLVSDVHKRLWTTKVMVQMMRIAASDLIGHFGPSQTRFDRIETSNIADVTYLNPVGAVGLIGPLLKPPSVNPHATLITLFMNAIHEMKPARSNPSDLLNTVRQAAGYLSPSPARHMCDASYLRTMSLVHGEIELRSSDLLVGHGDEGEHTVVEKWPMLLKKRPGQDGAQEEFQDLSNTQHTGSDRYVEWRLRR